MFKHYTWEHIELLWLSRWFWSYKLPISLQNNKTYECNAHNNDNDKNDKNNKNFNNKNNKLFFSLQDILMITIILVKMIMI